MVSTRYFLDTNILVHLVRRDGIGQYINAQYSLYLADPPPLVSDVSEGELRSLSIQWAWGKHKLEQMEFVLSCFPRVGINDPAIFNAYAAIDSYSESIGITMGKNDVWIAASARVTRARLLTTDKDFDHLESRFLVRDWIDPERDKKQIIH